MYVLGGRQYGPDFESVLSHCEVYEKGIWKVILSIKIQIFIYIYLFNRILPRCPKEDQIFVHLYIKIEYMSWVDLMVANIVKL